MAVGYVKNRDVRHHGGSVLQQDAAPSSRRSLFHPGKRGPLAFLRYHDRRRSVLLGAQRVWSARQWQRRNGQSHAGAGCGCLSFASVTTGLWHTCGLTINGVAYCWGDSRVGQLGVDPNTGSCPGGFPCSQTPVLVRGGHTFIALQAGGNTSTAAHTWGVTAPGAAYCGGANRQGQLGDGNQGTDSAVPVRVTPP